MTGFRKWWRRAFLALTVGIGVAAVVILRPWDRTPRRPPAQPLAPRPLAVVPGVYLLGRMSPAAAYAVDTADGLVLIDTGIEADAAAVTGQLADLGLDVSRTRAILLTHVHADHSLGAAELRKRTGAKVYAGRGDCPPLHDGGPREAFLSTFHMPNVTLHPTTVDVPLAGDEVIAVGDAKFTAVATPGHTPGSMC